MAERGIDLVRTWVDSINRGDWREVLLARVTPDVEYDLSRTISPLRGVYRGVDEVRRVAEEFFGPWEEVHYQLEDAIEVGEHVVTPFKSHFRGRQGIELDARATWVWTIDEGRLARLCLYQTREEALGAVGADDPAGGDRTGPG